MFDDIPFIKTKVDTPLTRSKKSRERIKNYSKEAVANAEFAISGTVKSFVKGPDDPVNTSNDFILQDFSIFNYRRGSYTKRNDYKSYLIAYTYAGSGKLIYDGKEYSLNGEGQGFFIDCTKQHEYIATDTNGWEVAILHIFGDGVERYYKAWERYNDAIFSIRRPEQLQTIIETMLRTHCELSENSYLYKPSSIDFLLAWLLKAKEQQDSKVIDIPYNIQVLIDYIHFNFYKNLTLDIMADVATTSKYYLIKQFKKYIGVTPGEYLISLRIDIAKNLLKKTNIPIYKIANEVGFTDINNFGNIFKKRCGCTPKQYRVKSRQ